MSRYSELQTYVLKKYSRRFLKIRPDHSVGLISQHSFYQQFNIDTKTSCFYHTAVLNFLSPSLVKPHFLKNFVRTCLSFGLFISSMRIQKLETSSVQMLHLYQRLILDSDNNMYVHTTVHEFDNKIQSLSLFLLVLMASRMEVMWGIHEAQYFFPF